MSSKKLLNSAASAVDESIDGLVAVHPGLRRLQGHRVVLRADTQQVISEKKVTLLSGGGSGHEPSQAGFVGRGMLTAAVLGAVFASPPPASILAALRAVQSPAGTLMIVTNYTGDRLTFGIALERAKLEGICVTMVTVGDDCALPTAGDHSSAGRRGLCGTILVHKVIGALAEQGASLDDITTTAETVAANIATMGVSLTACCVPGNLPSFSLADDEMELGLGVHGEAGMERIKMLPVDTVVKRILEQITSQEPGYQFFSVKPGMKVAVIVNNLGSTSKLELYIVANSVLKYLASDLNLDVVKTYIGGFMTSLEMAGVSLTLFNILHNNWVECLEYPTTAPGWPNELTGITSTVYGGLMN